MKNLVLIRNRMLNLRRNQTDAEKRLWFLLRNQQFGRKFRRQQAIDHYIVDFICLEARLIIELDGGQHNEEADKVRTDYLRKQGFSILRFWNHDVLSNREGVSQSIRQALAKDPLTRLP